jgi:xanthine dehydrogenase iron-sulfur cluster and FAD-binding subunit A
MTLMWKTYHTPASVQQALQILASEGPSARVVAGATDLILELERGLRPGVKTLIDITRIAGLNEITLDNQGWIHLGPLVTHNQCAASDMLAGRAFCLAKACWEVGAPQIRTRATVAGNLITASPANDAIAPLMALGAQVTLTSQSGARRVPLAEFYVGVRKTVMQPEELLTDIAFPALPQEGRSMFYKLGLRRAQAISVVNAAVVLHMNGDVVSRAVITLGSVAPTIVHAESAEKHLQGKRLTQEMIGDVAALAVKAATPIDDVRGSAWYRREMVRVCTLRALRSLASGREGEELPRRLVLLETNHRGETIPAEGMVHAAGTPIETTINGKHYSIRGGQDKTLLRMLREDVGLTGTKEGCAEGECGACTVFLDGKAVMSCLVPAPRAHGAEITTVEGLASQGELHAVQKAFIEEGAVQCGYCTPGFIMSAAKLLEELPSPGAEEIRQAISGNLCRCTGYYKIISAIEKATQVR